MELFYMLNLIVWNWTLTFNCFYTKTTLILTWIVWIRTVWLNWIAWKIFLSVNCVSMLNSIVKNRNFYLYKNRFGIKQPTKVDMSLNRNKQTKIIKPRSILCLFVAASHQTRLDTWSKAQRPIKVGIKGRGRSGTSRDSNPAGLCCSSAHLVLCEPDKASSFMNPNLCPGTYAGLWLELDAKV